MQDRAGGGEGKAKAKRGGLTARPQIEERGLGVRLGDILAPGLDVLFVGLNPGRHSAQSGHHFAGPGNLFWRLLHEAGFTPRRLVAAEDRALLQWRLGLTNLVDRPSRGQADLRRAELVAGGEALRAKVATYRPRIVACLGKEVFRAYADRPAGAALPWGWQPPVQAGVLAFLAPNPSPRSTIPYAQRLALFQELARAARRTALEHPLAGQEDDGGGAEQKR